MSLVLVAIALAAVGVTVVAWWRETSLRSEIRRRDSKIAEWEERYRAVVELANVGVWITDEDGLTTFTDPRLCRALGYRPDELRGQPLDDFVVHRKRRVNGQSRLAATFAGKKGAKAIDEGELKRRNGETIPVLLADRRLHNGNGDGSAALTLIVDPGGQRRAEEETTILQNQFFELISHELRTPLTAMIGYLEMIEATQANNLDTEGREYFDVISANTDRLSSLLADLMLLSQVEAGTFSIECDQNDLAELAAGSVENLTELASSEGIELSYGSRSKLGCWGDAKRLSQVLDNLILNAIKFTPEGGRIEVGIAGDGESAVIEVADDGPGIPEEDSKYLFDRFYRASEARKMQVQGLGLGLAIVKAIVDAHGGRISLESDPEQGTTFRVELPRQRPKPGSERWARTSAVRRSAKVK